MLSQVNYRVPNMRFLRERLTVMDTWGYLLARQGRPVTPNKGPDWQSCSVHVGPRTAQRGHHLRTVCSAVPQPHVQRPEDGA